MRVLLSGIQPTGSIHIGNYLGVIRQFVHLQDGPNFGQRILTIADLHSISTGFIESIELRANIRHTLAVLLSSGIDPEKTLIVQQSRLAEHAQLMWILGATTTLPTLAGIGQFKDKSKMYKHGSIPVGLLTYPLLQAADILAYKASDVLVGIDQNQHLEIVREIAKSFNWKMGQDFFPIPEKMLSTNPKIKSLKDPTKKMSKSDMTESSRVNVLDPPNVVVSKIKAALSDINPKITYEWENRPAISNLVTFYSLYSILKNFRWISTAHSPDRARRK